MFGNSIFRNDPFFNQNTDVMSEFDRMDQRMDHMLRSSFGMGMPMMPSIMGPPMGDNGMGRQQLQRQQQQQQQQLQQQQQMTPFGGSMFGNMFGNMDAMFSRMQNDPNAHSFSSSRVISYSSDGSSAPKYYEASSETTQGPGGVRQTRKSERNSVTGLDRMAVGHHIYDRGHVVERSRNRRTNEREENQEFLNMDEEEKDAFHQEWQQKSRAPSRENHIGYDSNNPRRQQRAIDSAEYHRSNIDNHRNNVDRDRPRERHGDRGDRDRHRDGRRVQINSRAEEI